MGKLWAHISLVFIYISVILIFPTAATAADKIFGQSPGTHATAIQYPYYPYGWGWGYPYYYDTRGKIKLRAYNESDNVFINGAYAGTAKKRHEIKLDPGTYNIEVRRQGKTLVNRNVYVLAQKTVEINVPFR